MRITVEGPLAPLHGAVSGIEAMFMDKMKHATKTATRTVMLGDATVTSQSTFDPRQVSDFFKTVMKSLPQWSTHGVTITNNEDIRRVFVKFQTNVGKYVLSGHFSVQFHVLLYYVPDQRVVDCQKALSETIDASKSGEEDLARISEEGMVKHMRSLGYDKLDTQDLFEILYENDDIRASLESQLEEGRTTKIRQLQQRKRDLFEELDSLLTEVYQCSAVLIDDARLVTGEEGCLCTFDVELVEDGRRVSIPEKLDADTMASLQVGLAQVAAAIRAQL